MALIDKEQICAEIERRKKENMFDEQPMTIGRYYEDRDLLAFLDTLPEQPVEGLEEELDAEIAMEWAPFNKHLVKYEDRYGEVIWLNFYSFEYIARHFAKWGAEHAKKED